MKTEGRRCRPGDLGHSRLGRDEQTSQVAYLLARLFALEAFWRSSVRWAQAIHASERLSTVRAGFADFEQGGSYLPSFSDDGFGEVDAVGGEVLAETAELDAVAELGLPPA